MIYSIGHGGTTPGRVKAIMDQRRLSLLIDVRSKPYSRHQPEFNKNHLAAFFGASYQHHPELGGLNGPVSIAALQWLRGMGECADLLIMCAESDPTKCHRHYELAKRLWDEFGMKVIHLLPNGDERQAFQAAPAPAQTRLF